jgi:hypothetical protein
MVTAFFPASPIIGSASLQSTGVDGDERESAWSIMARAVQAATQRLRDNSFALSVDGTGALTVSRSSNFSMTLTSDVATLTGLPGSASGASSYTGSVVPAVIVPQGLRMAPPGWSTGKGGVSADATAVAPLRWQAASLSVAVAFDFADAFAQVRTLRSGIWDVVAEGVWLGRMRVTGSVMQPQGRLPGIVEVVLNGVATP